MANFSTNQAKQLYVVKALQQSAISTLGDLMFGTTEEGDIYAKYFGTDGKVRTDLIQKNKVHYLTLAEADDQKSQLDNVFVKVDAPVAGQHYILNVTVDEFGGMTPEDKGFIFADYAAKVGDTTDDLVANLAVSLAKNASKAAYNQLIKVYVSTATDPANVSNPTEVTADAEVEDIAGNSLASILIVAAEQPWVLGKQQFELLHFNVNTVPVVSNGMEMQWSTISKNKVSGYEVVNSKKVADLEYFCAGERGDIYRGMGYPNNFDFKPIVDPTSANGYDIVTLGYYWQGDAEDIQKSPKELVFVANKGTGSSILSAIQNLLEA